MLAAVTLLHDQPRLRKENATHCCSLVWPVFKVCPLIAKWRLCLITFQPFIATLIQWRYQVKQLSDMWTIDFLWHMLDVCLCRIKRTRSTMKLFSQIEHPQTPASSFIPTNTPALRLTDAQCLLYIFVLDSGICVNKTWRCYWIQT